MCDQFILMASIKIFDYKPEHQPWFESLNRQWIEAYFEMENLDEYVLTNPEAAILNPGGAIVMASYEGDIAGTVALRKLNATTYEFTKMAVAERYRRRGIAEALSYACLAKAKELAAATVILYTNSKLKPAIQLYEKLGFIHLAADPEEYKRSDVKMSLTLKD